MQRAEDVFKAHEYVLKHIVALGGPQRFYRNKMNGTVTFNEVYDPQLDIIVRVKEKHEQSIQFNPQQMQPINRNTYPPPPPPPPGSTGQGYNNVVLNWEGQDGLAAISEILHRLYPNLPVHRILTSSSDLLISEL